MKFQLIMKYYTVNYKSEIFQAILLLEKVYYARNWKSIKEK